MNFINTLRNTIANLVAVKETNTVCHQPDHLKMAQYQPHDRTTSIPKSSAAKKQNFEGITGQVSVELIRNLDSNVLRKSLMGKIVYSYLSRGFQEWQKRGTRTENSDTLDKALNHAAEAVAVSESLGYMVDMSPENFTFLILNGVPNKMSEAHAKMITDITGGDIKALIAKRDDQRKAKLTSNSESLETYLNAVVSYSPVTKLDGMGDPIPMDEPELFLSGASAMSALASCMEFVTSWSNEIAMAAEMLLIKADTKVIEQALAKSDRKQRAEAPSYVSKLDDALLDQHGMAAGAASGK